MMRYGLIISLVLATLIPIRAAQAQAYCALRDPVKQVYELFPDATSYRSIVETVDDDTRREVQSSTGLDLHFNELGRHTLYVAIRDERPLGLVHVRTEQGPWGLMEVAWSLNLDLTIRDFALQRCRSRERATVSTRDFHEEFRGKTANDLRAWIDDNGKLSTRAPFELPERARNLAASIVFCGIKTLVVTDLIWPDELDALRVLDYAHRTFPGTAGVERIGTLYTSDVEEVLADLGLSSDTTDRSRTVMIRVRGSDGALIGLAHRCQVTVGDMDIAVWWNIDPDLTVTSVTAESGWPDAATQRAFESAVQMNLEKAAHCATAAELKAAEALVLAHEHGVDD